MKNIKILTALLLLAATISGLSAEMKRYEIKSGIVEYTISGGGNIMGIGSKTEGTSKLIFKEYGNLERHEEQSSTTTMGRTDKSHNITMIKDGKFYGVDFEEKIIIEHSPEMFKQMSDKDMTKMGKEMMEKMGGKKIGKEKVLGHNCEIWEVMGTKTWIYKGIPLKSEANIMGMKHLQVATKAKFNVSISDKEFKLPDFPIKTMDQMIQEQTGERGMPQGDMPKKMPSPEEMQQMQEMMKNLGGMLGGGN